jgi:hypothetical protein
MGITAIDSGEVVASGSWVVVIYDGTSGDVEVDALDIRLIIGSFTDEQAARAWGVEHRNDFMPADQEYSDEFAGYQVQWARICMSATPTGRA